MELRDFLDQTFVQSALRNPTSPTSVLTFWFGADYSDDTTFERMVRNGDSVLEMRNLWFSTRDEFDNVCQPFRDTVHAAGRRALTGQEWESTVDGQMGQLILCDQLTRTIFRGSERAFAYDARARELARNLSASLLGRANDSLGRLSGEFYAQYLVFLQTAFMHSESPSDHDELKRVRDYADEHAPPSLRDWFDLMRQGGEAHTRVIERFGRYPHRNAAMLRTSTSEELEWLADVENLPSWARSQMVPGEEG